MLKKIRKLFTLCSIKRFQDCFTKIVPFCSVFVHFHMLPPIASQPSELGVGNRQMPT